MYVHTHRTTGVYNSSSTHMQDKDAKENLQLERQALKEVLQSSWPPIFCTGHQIREIQLYTVTITFVLYIGALFIC